MTPRDLLAISTAAGRLLAAIPGAKPNIMLGVDFPPELVEQMGPTAGATVTVQAHESMGHPGSLLIARWVSEGVEFSACGWRAEAPR